MTGELVSRVATGIPGLDTVLEGGFLTGGVYIVEGPPGVGKTTLGSHFCFNHAASGGRAVYITLLAESHTRLLAHLRRMTFFDANLVPERVSFISAFKVLESEGLSSLIKLVRQTISAQKATVVILDGLVAAEEVSPSAKDFKKFIHELQVVTSMVGCTALLLNSTERSGGSRPERTMVDGILELEDEIKRLRAVRHLSVRKMRGASQVRGKHYFEISDDGLRVLPRIETVGVHPDVDRATPGPERVSFGIPAFDEMTLGGVPEGSVTALVGPSGCGKTIMGLHFLHAGVERNERGAYFGFFERPAAILEKSKRLGVPLAASREGGLVEVHWSRPVEGVIDELADRLLHVARRDQLKRLFIDGLQGFQAAAETTERLREVMSCLVDQLESMGVTAVYSSETPDLFGEELQLSNLGMSALTHNIVLLKHVERTSRTRRTITVLKLRDSGHDLSVREFAISPQGLVVAAEAPAESSEVVIAARVGREKPKRSLRKQQPRTLEKKQPSPRAKASTKRKQRA